MKADGKPGTGPPPLPLLQQWLQQALVSRKIVSAGDFKFQEPGQPAMPAEEVPVPESDSWEQQPAEGEAYKEYRKKASSFIRARKNWKRANAKYDAVVNELEKPESFSMRRRAERRQLRNC